jgi:hypothetical protein
MRFKEMFRLAKKLSGQSDVLSQMDDDTVNDLVLLCTETLDRSKPEWTKEQKEDFITMNFNSLIGIIFEINSPKE